MSKHKCTGVIFRGYSNQYFDKNNCAFNYKEGFRLLKRDACRCLECKELVKYLTGYGENVIDCAFWFKTFNHSPIVDGAKYKMIVNEWESEWDEGSNQCWHYPETIKMEILKK